jgi:NTE family protein
LSNDLTIQTNNLDKNLSHTRPKLGIAFGGGGLRGMAHIGLIEELDKRGVRADMVAGTSIGSLIGSLYACGYKGKFLAALLENLNLKQIMAISPSKTGLTSGRNYAEFARIMTKGRNIEETEIPLRIVATDLQHGEMEIFDKGPIWRAVHASSAVPGVFSPVAYRGRTFVDGCLVDNCPCRVLREMGADVVVGVDLDKLKNYDEPAPRKQNIIDILQRSVDVVGMKNSSASEADVRLTPMTKYMPSMDLGKVEYALECGRREAAAKIDEIMALLDK